MPTRNTRSIGRSWRPQDYDGLLNCRMEMLGLDMAATEDADRATLDQIRDLCASCAFREPCAVDLKRDPNNPVWETYCPTAGLLIDLAAQASAAV